MVEYELSVKLVERNVLEAELEAEELGESERYQRIQQQIAELRSQQEVENSHFQFGDTKTGTPDQ